MQSSPESQRQIISLGAGSDTRYFRMMHEAEQNSSNPTSSNTAPASSSGTSTPTLAIFPLNILYHEFDFAVNTQRKISTIMANPRLRALVGDPLIVRWREAELHGPHYHLHACDLRDLDVSRPWINADKPMHFDHLDPALPTLLISECCLTYLAPGEADAVVGYFASKVLSPSAPLGLVLYEPINPFDGFGKVMVSNLARRGIVLQTMRTYHSLAAQRERLRAYGLTAGQGAVDMDFLFEHWVDEQERKRVVRVEMLDEVEELNLLAKHYCVAWGWRDGEDASVWERWRKLEEAEEDPA
jgi:[phosphatase 2A protein]-leucine-carboxy methyltransferase